MAKRSTGRGGYWCAGLGWGIAAGVALGALLLAPNMTQEQVVPAEDTVSHEEHAVVQQEADIAAAHALVSDEAVGSMLPDVISGTLTDRPVLVMSTADAAPEDVDAIRWLLGHSGANDAGHIMLTDSFVSQESADELSTLAAATLPAGAQLSTEAVTPGTHAGEVLGAALLLDPETAEPLATTEERALVLQSLRDAGFVDYTEGTILPAQVIIVVTGANDGTGDGAFAAESVANLAQALDAQGSGAVLAGRIESAAESGPLGLIRADEAASSEVTTVDSVDKEFGRGGAVLGVNEQLAGQAGAYGAALEATAAMPPVDPTLG